MAYCRVDDAGDGPLLTMLLAAAREVVELYTGRALISQGFLLVMPNWEAGYAENYPREFQNNYFNQAPAVGLYSMFPNARRDTLNAIFLDRSPLITVDAVKYYDPAETLQTLAAGNYYALTNQNPGAFALKTTQSWPDIFDRPDAVQVSFTAGHGTTAASIPAPLRLAVMILAKHYFDAGRDMVDVKQAVSEIPLGVRHIMESWRVEGFTA